MTTNTMSATKTAEQAAGMMRVYAEVCNGIDLIRHGINDYDQGDEVRVKTLAMIEVAQTVADSIRDILTARIQQAAWQLAIWDIMPMIRNGSITPEDGPIHWLTGNSMMPPLRCFTAAEVIWEASGDLDWPAWQLFTERFDEVCEKQHIYVASPEYDNSLYGVDMLIWETTDQEGDDISSDWQRKAQA